MLIEELKRQGKPYGLFFSRVTGGYTTTGRRGLQAFTVIPLIVYRVYADGRPGRSRTRCRYRRHTPAELLEDRGHGRPPGNIQRHLRSGIGQRSRVGGLACRFDIGDRGSEEATVAGPAAVPARAGGGRVKLLVSVFFCAAAALAQAPGAAQDPILRAMTDELERARGLAVGLRPYFIEYQLEDVQTYTANATLGGLLTSMSRQYRVPLLDVRVGDYNFDDSNSVFANAYSGARFDAQSWPIDDRYDVLRRYLWLATDRSYKTALEAMSRKRSALKNMSEDPAEKLPDFWKAPATKMVLPKVDLQVDTAVWEKRVRECLPCSVLFPKWSIRWWRFRSRTEPTTSSTTRVLSKGLPTACSMSASALSPTRVMASRFGMRYFCPRSDWICCPISLTCSAPSTTLPRNCVP